MKRTCWWAVLGAATQIEYEHDETPDSEGALRDSRWWSGLRKGCACWMMSQPATHRRAFWVDARRKARTWTRGEEATLRSELPLLGIDPGRRRA